MSQPNWQFWIDVGGTFTDCIALRPSGAVVRHKLLSSGVCMGSVEQESSSTKIFDQRRTEPDGFFRGWRFQLLGQDGNVLASSSVGQSQPSPACLQLTAALPIGPTTGATYQLIPSEPAPIVAIRRLMNLATDDEIPICNVRLGTTRGTNALLTRTGASVALVTTQGFGDVLLIGDQSRPDIFALNVVKTSPLTNAVLEVDQRVGATGKVLHEPDWKQVHDQLERLRADGIESIAVCLLHADLFPDHERRIGDIAGGIGFGEVSLSHQVARMPGFVARAQTTVVDAYLNPVLREYVAGLRAALPGSDMKLLTSSGGLVSAAEFSGTDSILSGPAGGVVGLAQVAQACGFDRALGLDMGGTSTDVARFDGEFDLQYESEKAGVRVVAPMLAIHTVAAGGGSICRFDGVKLVVGPQSAGAEPGPACYGRGGPLTVTDLNLLLGRIAVDQLPIPLDLEVARWRTRELARQVYEATQKNYTETELAQALIDIANANMAAAIRTLTAERGDDPTDFTLVAFGGAAPQHACAVAEQLGIERIIVHPDAGILSAVGAGLAQLRRQQALGVDLPLEGQGLASASRHLDELRQNVARKLEKEGVATSAIEYRHLLDIRYEGTDWPITLPEPDEGNWLGAFEKEHQRLFGYLQSQRDIRVCAVRVEGSLRADRHLPASHLCDFREISRGDLREIWFVGQLQQASVVARDWLQAGDTMVGPAVVVDRFASVVIDPGWRGQVYSQGEVIVERLHVRDRAHNVVVSDQVDPARLEIFNNLLVAIAKQMGETLRRTASSVNVKQRLDFSCALFTADGKLVANAPHVPVHLGAMGETVRCILQDNPDMRPLDVYVTNDPYRGGSHLPDVTVITPVHSETGALRFFTASRAHHAEIGGKVPGSMPPDSTMLGEEGVVIGNFKLVAEGVSREDALRKLLESGPFPSRAVEENLADIRAQVAANRQGVVELNAMIERFGWQVVDAYMRYVQDAASEATRRAIRRKLTAGRREFVDYLQTADGCHVPVRVAITCDHDVAALASDGACPLRMDFSGTADVVAGNLNANRAIVRAAVIYCLRLLVDDDIPLNDGVLQSVEIVLPECMLNPQPDPDPAKSPAVAAGNVETSQRIVDVTLGAMGVAAASQGTMNNLIFGDASFGYYETICGGSGATATNHGADAVQVHMTNTRITDTETLERRYPARLKRFAVRQDSGGAGKRQGGRGVTREIEFLAPVDVSLITSRRGKHPPYGLQGGQPGSCGMNTLVRSDGTPERLPAICHISVQAGDRIIIDTPGGGGFSGPAPSK